MKLAIVLTALAALVSGLPATGATAAKQCKDVDQYPSETCGKGQICIVPADAASGTCYKMAKVGEKCMAKPGAPNAIFCAPNAACSESMCVDRVAMPGEPCGWYGEFRAYCFTEKETEKPAFTCKSAAGTVVKKGEKGTCG